MEPIIILPLLFSAGSLLISYLSWRDNNKSKEQNITRSEHLAFEQRIKELEINAKVISSHVDDLDDGINAKLNSILRELDLDRRRSRND